MEIGNDLQHLKQDKKASVRVFARTVSYQLTESELKEVAGGENFSCELTKYPNFDTSCEL